MKYNIAISDQKFEIEIGEITAGIARINVNGEPLEVLIENYDEVTSAALPLRPAPARVVAPAPVRETAPVAPKAPAPVRAAAPAPVAPPKPAAPAAAPSPRKVVGKGDIVAPIPGRITSVRVKEGDTVSRGQTVATMEAMKMENNIVSAMDGFVKELRVQKDSEVATGQVIMVIG
ncbi:MAG: biotin/lipoyl-binding protein [Proteobacteria bacterium]|nr:biotin/lipoyl-binding protein [Pseudomonadota bacterium]